MDRTDLSPAPIPRRRRAFSLVEVLMAVFLAGLCAAVLAATMPVATASRIRADLNNKATSLAQKQVEAVRGLGYANLVPQQLLSYGLIDSTTPVGATTDTFSFTQVDNGLVDSPAQVLPDGVGEIRVEQADFDLRRVTVEIRYTDRGRPRAVRVATLVANL